MSDPYIDDLGVRRDTHYVDTLGIVREHERKRTSPSTWASSNHASGNPLSHGEIGLLAGWAYVVAFFAVLLVLVEVLGPFVYLALGAGIIWGVWRLAVSPRTRRVRLFLQDVVEELRERVGL